MSAVRMVAYGVLELDRKPSEMAAFFSDDVQGQERERKAMFERDQLRKLVNDELKSYGLLLTRQLKPTARSWRTSHNTHVLYGQLQKGGFATREELCVGSFKECCEEAAKLLDKLDASQVPDTES